MIVPPLSSVVPDCTAPLVSSSVPPESTIVLMAVPPVTSSSVAPLEIVKPERMPPRISVPPGNSSLAQPRPPPDLTISVPPLEMTVLLCGAAGLHYLVPPLKSWRSPAARDTC